MKTRVFRLLKGSSILLWFCLLSGLAAVAAPHKRPPEFADTDTMAVSTGTAAAQTTEALPQGRELSGEEIERPAEAVPEETTDRPFKVHTVWLWQESRDCLWNIAQKYYGDPWQWKKIYLANRSQINDPRKIMPRQVLIIPPADDETEKKQ